MNTLKKTVALFLGEYDTRPATRKSYYYDLAALLRFLGEDRPVETLTPLHILEYTQHLRARLREGDGICSPVTFNKHIKTMRAFFNWCVRMKLIAESPASQTRRERVNPGVDPKKVMPETVYAELLAFARWDARSHALVLFLGDTGCRIGGAAALRWEDVDLDHSTATTVQKGKPPQKVYFGHDCRVALRRWKQRQADRRVGPFVFSRDGRRMTNDSLGQFFSRLCQRAELGTWGPHSLRHRLGFRAVRENVPMPVLAAILGDTVKVTIDNYAHFDEAHVREAVQRLAASGQFATRITPLDEQTG